MFNRNKIAELEQEIASLKLSNEAYKLRNEQIEKSEVELESAKLKIEVMNMLINDDEAIIELLAALSAWDETFKAKEVKAKEEKKFTINWGEASAQAESAHRQALYSKGLAAQQCHASQAWMMGAAGGISGLAGLGWL